MDIDFSAVMNIKKAGTAQEVQQENNIGNTGTRALTNIQETEAAYKNALLEYGRKKVISANHKVSILKGIQAHDDMLDLFVTAIECIGLLSSDKTFSDQAIKEALENYE